jgi:RNA polymerase sigma-70 factor (ECF subfamily)
LQQALKPNPQTEPDLEQIYTAHHQRVLRAAYRVTGSAQDAEDVLQTVFLRLVRREGGSPLSDSLGNYLHRAAVNAALDIVRSRKTSRLTPLEGVEATLASGSETSPDDTQSVAEVKDQIRAALGKMSAKAGEIFVLRYFEGYGNHEIAGMLGTSRSTVNVILHRTRERLREELASYLGEKP